MQGGESVPGTAGTGGIVLCGELVSAGLWGDGTLGTLGTFETFETEGTPRDAQRDVSKQTVK